MKKILISLSVIAAVAAVVFGITTAFFSDQEASIGNTFTAGSLDLKVDSTCHYNGMVCTSGVWVDDGTPGSKHLLDQSCACTWLEKDLTTGDLFFNFTDVKPGDEGENTISLHAIDNDAYVCGYVFNLANNDNGLTEPESKVDATDGAGNGELQNNLYVKIWRDTGKDVGGQPVGVACDNIYQTGEEVLVNDVPIDSNIGGWYLGQLAKSVTTCLGVAWNIPNTVGNVIQSDSVKGDIYFYVEQVRNNPSFTCPQPERIDNTLVFGPFGWAGWSCPAGMHVVGGGVAAGATVLVSQPAKPGVGTYPLYPHYNYTPPEEGWVVQNNNDNETITYYVDCL